MRGVSEELKTDVLIIGAGGAGVRVAIELARRGVDCLVLGKRAHGDAHTIWAAGGINASLGTVDPEDRWDIHAADTLKEGHMINQPDAVRRLCHDAPYRLFELDEWQAGFNRAPNRRINQRYFGAQSFRRTCFVGDRTGRAVLEAVIGEARRLRVPYREDLFITRLLTGDSGVAGAVGVDRKTGRIVQIRARTVVLAAGGHTSLFRLSSSRPDENNGDAPALAYEAGATLRDMEMVQFHPTGRAWPPQHAGRLVTEAVRGEGGRLYNVNGERFMERYSPKQKELDARDVVARCNYREIQEGRGTKRNAVLLDITHRDADYIKERLPHMYEVHKEDGIDITRQPMEVAPTAHYAMGGIVVDFESGATGVPGLYAVGEATSGVHGANRLGGNSLAEIFVFGKITGEYLAESIGQHPWREISAGQVDDHLKTIHEPLQRPEGIAPAELVTKLRDILWDGAGIVRHQAGMKAGLSALQSVREQEATMRVDGDLRSADFEHAHNLHYMLTTGESILRSALERTESRGAHYREDHPDKDPDWQRNIQCEAGADGMKLTTRPVPPVPEDLHEALDQEHELDYHYVE